MKLKLFKHKVDKWLLKYDTGVTLFIATVIIIGLAYLAGFTFEGGMR